MGVSYIELTSYSAQSARYLGGPYFDTDLWPLLLRNIDEIEKVFMFSHESSKIPSQSLTFGLRVSPKIRDIGPMNPLSPENVATIAAWSFGGHISVLYQLAKDSTVLRELADFYPSGGELCLNSGDEMGLTDEARVELAGFLNTLPAGYVVLAFAHDADPLFIFGSEEELTSLIHKSAVALRQNRP